MKFKKITAIFLIALIINFTIVSDKRNVDAAFLLDDIAIITVVGLSLVAAGVIFSNSDSLQYSAQQFWDQASDNVKKNYQAAVSSNLGYMFLNDLTWNNIKNYVTGNYTPGDQVINFIGMTSGTAQSFIGKTGTYGLYNPNGFSCYAVKDGDSYVVNSGNHTFWMDYVPEFQIVDNHNGYVWVSFKRYGTTYGVSIPYGQVCNTTVSSKYNYNNESLVSNPGDFVNTGSSILSVRDRRIYLNPNIVTATSLVASYSNFIHGQTSSSVRNNSLAYPAQNIYQPGQGLFDLPDYVIPSVISPTITTPVEIDLDRSISADFPAYEGDDNTLTGISALIGGVWSVLVGGFNGISAWFGDLWTLINVGLTNLGDWVGDILSSITAYFPSLIQNLVLGFESLLNGLSSIWQSVVNGFDSIATYLNHLLDKVRIGFAEIALAIAGVISALSTLFAEVVSYLVDITNYLNPLSNDFILKLAFVPPEGVFENDFTDMKVAFMNKIPHFPDMPQFFDRSISWKVSIGGSVLPSVTFNVIDNFVLASYRDTIKNWIGAILLFMTGLWLFRKIPELLEV